MGKHLEHSFKIIPIQVFLSVGQLERPQQIRKIIFLFVVVVVVVWSQMRLESSRVQGC